MSSNLQTLPLGEAIEWLDDMPVALLSLGIPRCPASRMLEASLEAVAGSRPRLPVARVVLGSPDDWTLRETLLWPREIRVSRSSVPVLVVLRHGRMVAARHGSAPAHVLDAWLRDEVGPPEQAVDETTTTAERAVLDTTAARRTQHLDVKSRHEPGL